MKPKCVTIHMKAIERYFHVALFILLCKVVLTLEEPLVCDHSRSWTIKGFKTMSDRLQLSRSKSVMVKVINFPFFRGEIAQPFVFLSLLARQTKEKRDSLR